MLFISFIYWWYNCNWCFYEAVCWWQRLSTPLNSKVDLALARNLAAPTNQEARIQKWTLPQWTLLQKTHRTYILHLLAIKDFKKWPRVPDVPSTPRNLKSSLARWTSADPKVDPVSINRGVFQHLFVQKSGHVRTNVDKPKVRLTLSSDKFIW